MHADKEKITQVISNLLSNAVDYSAPEREVVVSSEDLLDGATIRIRDFGVGVLIAEQKKIFRQYYRGTNMGVGYFDSFTR